MKVEDILARYGMTLDNWEADPSMVADLINEWPRPEELLTVPPMAEILLAAGEMTDRERRTVKAVLTWFVNKHNMNVGK